MARGEISIADLLRSLAHLRPGGPEAVEALCAALHFQFARELISPPLTPEPDPAGHTMAQREEQPQPTKGVVPAELKMLPLRVEEPRPWMNAEPLSLHPLEARRPDIESLLSPQGRTALLSTALATREEGREFDLPGVIDTLASGRVLCRLARVSVPSLRRGIQVLADVGEGMLPYASDRGELVAAIQRIVGQEQTKVAMFAGTPLRKAGRGPRHKWDRWTPPPRGTPVLLLTDLGIGGPLLSHDRAPLGEWLRFCEEVRRARCPLVAFVPYEPRRWPAELARAMTLLLWDRGTTVSAVRHAVGPGLRKTP